MKMRFICLFATVLLLHLSEIHADNEVLNKLESMSGRIGNIEETLGVLIDAVSGLVHAVNKLEKVYECGWPKLAHGHFEGNSSYYRGVLRAICDEGYTIKGMYLVECQTDGIWTEMPECIADCKPPYVQHSVELNETSYPYNSRIVVECKFGYKRSAGSGYMRCLGDNKWTDFIVCHPVDCGLPPKATHGTYGYSYSTSFNSTLSLTCEEGYHRNGPDVIRCTGHRAWDGEQTCLRRICVDVENGNGTNRTECLLQQVDAYALGDIIGKMQNRDASAAECIRYCFAHHNSFTAVNMYGPVCICMHLSNKESVAGTSSSDAYFRTEDILLE